MDKNKRFVITINRELGSGGRTVGEKLAKRLGVAFYDKAIIKALEEKYHLTVREVEKLKGQKKNWWSDFMRVVSVGNAFVIEPYYETPLSKDQKFPTTEEIFRTEREILRDIAEQESCVITGRCAFRVLGDFPNHLSILIHAPMEQRIQRVMRKKGLSREKVEKIIDQVDKMRENYVTHYTGTSRYDARNYDIVLSMEGLTEDDAVDVIMEYIAKSE